MRSDPFYFEIKDAMTQFVAAFNDIVIKRHDKYRNKRSSVKVRYVYAPKQRVIHDLTNKARHLTLPVVAVNIASISRDNSRVFNKIYGSSISTAERNYKFPRPGESLTTYNIPQPVPVNIDVSMSILARYQTDVEQIISNFIPYNDPYIIISWKLPKAFFPDDVEIRTEVLWNESLNMNYPDTITSSEPYRLSCDTMFTLKTWLFKQAPEDPANTIYKITSNISLLDDIDYKTPYHDSLTESSLVESIGPPLTAAPYITHVSDSTSNHDVLGYNFNNTTSVYLSSNEINDESGVVVSPMSGENISTSFPAFTGVPIQFNIVNENKIVLDTSNVRSNLPADLIIVNDGGYSTAITSPHHGYSLNLNSSD